MNKNIQINSSEIISESTILENKNTISENQIEEDFGEEIELLQQNIILPRKACIEELMQKIASLK